MRVALGQINTTVGDVEGNLAKIHSCLELVGKNIDLLVFPEMCLTGYPPRDLLYNEELLFAVDGALKKIMETSARFPGLGIVVGAPKKTHVSTGAGLENSVFLIMDGEILATRAKTLLPTSDVFDEIRYFDPGLSNAPVAFKGEKLGLTVCEDALSSTEALSDRAYGTDPIKSLLEQGATMLINISASPYHMGKERVRFQRLSEIARQGHIPVVYVNQVGGNDELVFDGGGFVLDGDGELLLVQKTFESQLSVVDLEEEPMGDRYPEMEPMESLKNALTLGLRDYLHKCGFSKAVLGLSGGIDSAVTCCLAVEALGAENVCGVSMPSPFSSQLSLELARKQAENLGIRFEVISIGEPLSVFRKVLKAPLGLDDDVDITVENLQARIRGALLMAFSNRQGYMVLATGNKSELSVGYCTLYGDMCGGLAVISDVPKTVVYDLARHINSQNGVIPQQVIDRVPSAELRPNQKDQDTLPPYPVLDTVLKAHIEKGLGASAMVKQGQDPDHVSWILRTLHRNEYKRRQAAAGIRVTPKAFGVGRRMPVAAKYPDEKAFR